jgi:hypothetical protein
MPEEIYEIIASIRALVIEENKWTVPVSDI